MDYHADSTEIKCIIPKNTFLLPLSLWVVTANAQPKATTTTTIKEQTLVGIGAKHDAYKVFKSL